MGERSIRVAQKRDVPAMLGVIKGREEAAEIARGVAIRDDQGFRRGRGKGMRLPAMMMKCAKAFAPPATRGEIELRRRARLPSEKFIEDPPISRSRCWPMGMAPASIWASANAPIQRRHRR